MATLYIVPIPLLLRTCNGSACLSIFGCVRAMPGEASPLLAGSPPAIELRRARVVACMLVIAFSASIAKTFVDRALDATEYAIADLRNAPLIVSTLPGASTGVYALGKAFSLSIYRFGGRIPLFLIMITGLAASLCICIGTTPALFASWLPWRFAGAYAIRRRHPLEWRDATCSFAPRSYSPPAACSPAQVGLAGELAADRRMGGRPSSWPRL